MANVDHFVFSRRPGPGSWMTKSAIFQLEDARQKNIGNLTVSWDTAIFKSGDGRSDLSLKKNFWHTKWLYDNEDDRLFADVMNGWGRTVQFADGTEFKIHIKRKNFFMPDDVDYQQLITFTSNGETVFTMKNFTRPGFLEGALLGPMDGTIETTINDLEKVIGMILYYQTFSRNQYVA